ncbi:MAG: hypothetical protein JW751_01325 [Polyangiaceae bacterium]|nr:hypothetical protein [Polyangiaceae bacterium]
MRSGACARRSGGGFAWTDDGRRRLALCLVLAALPLLVGVLTIDPERRVPRTALTRRGARDQGSAPRLDMTGLARRLRAEIGRGTLGLGEALLQLHHAERRAWEPDATLDLPLALARYRGMLRFARGRLAAGEDVVTAVVNAFVVGRVTAYSTTNARIGDALLLGAANCEGVSHLVVSVLYDLGFEEQTTLLVYDNHLVPEIVVGSRARHFGLRARCHGTGARLEPLTLLDRFRAPSEPGRAGHFAYPETTDACEDPRRVYAAGVPLSKTEAPPPHGRPAMTRPRGCAFPLLAWLAPHDLVGLVDERQGLRVEQMSVTPEGLDAQSDNIACIERLLAQGLRAPDERLPFLGAALGHYERGALLYAAAGQLGLVRELEARSDRVRAEAQELLRIARGPTGNDLREGLAKRDAWPLIFLGEPGRELLFTLVSDGGQASAVAALLLYQKSRERAVPLAAGLDVSEQLEVLDLLELDNPWLMEDLGAAGAMGLLALDRLTNVLERRWRGCDLALLVNLVAEETRAAKLPEKVETPVILELAARRVAGDCLESRLSAEVLAFIRGRAATREPRWQRDLALIEALR